MHNTRTVPIPGLLATSTSSISLPAQSAPGEIPNYTSTRRFIYRPLYTACGSANSLPIRPHTLQTQFQSRSHSHHRRPDDVLLQLATSVSLNGDSVLPPAATSSLRRRKRVALGHTGILAVVGFTLLLTISCACWATPGIHRIASALVTVMKRTWNTLCTFDWRGSATFHVTPAMRTSVALSLVLGVLLGAAVGVVSGLEPAVVVGVSASMAIGCVFVMSFAVIHGVNALRAISFALFVSLCLPFGFGFGFGVGILISVFFGLEDPEDVADKTKDFVCNFPDFIKVVAAFTLEIL